MTKQLPALTGPHWKVFAIVSLFAVGLSSVGVLRFYGYHADNPPALAAYATVIYIGLTVFAAIALVRAEVPMSRLGFGLTFRPLRFFFLAVAGVGVIQLVGWLLDPLWQQIFGAGRDLSRFSEVSGSPAALTKLLILNWSVAAVGEELAFRIVLMRGIAFALGDSRMAVVVALIVQALVFALIHSYQGPAGVAGSMINGVIFGALTLAARGSIWPAALAHGSSNTIGIMRLYLAT